jgi:hypothetical protein
MGGRAGGRGCSVTVRRGRGVFSAFVRQHAGAEMRVEGPQDACDRARGGTASAPTARAGTLGGVPRLRAADVRDAVSVLRRVLDGIASGELDAPGGLAAWFKEVQQQGGPAGTPPHSHLYRSAQISCTLAERIDLARKPPRLRSSSPTATPGLSAKGARPGALASIERGATDESELRIL